MVEVNENRLLKVCSLQPQPSPRGPKESSAEIKVKKTHKRRGLQSRKLFPVKRTCTGGGGGSRWSSTRKHTLRGGEKKKPNPDIKIFDTRCFVKGKVTCLWDPNKAGGGEKI